MSGNEDKTINDLIEEFNEGSAFLIVSKKGQCKLIIPCVENEENPLEPHHTMVAALAIVLNDGGDKADKIRQDIFNLLNEKVIENQN